MELNKGVLVLFFLSWILTGCKNSMTLTHTNRLIKEKSPYLLQHAHNPVNWYPWGEEAFQKSHKENKPIFLSIGYSTCHWCHVMEHESFEDEDIARLMNEYFVSIKVDREERPDLDHIYMSAVGAMTGQGGWPLNVFLTPDKKPFWGGTYFPPEARFGSPGFKDVLCSLHEGWLNRKDQILTSAQSLMETLKQRTQTVAPAAINEKTLQKAFDQFNNYFDEQYGGFGSQPKFPSSHNLSFLLRWWQRTSHPKALEMVNKTLTEMYKGGMYDQLGGGFHRYSTDQYWQVPHFEKMLYDQAILSRTYLEAYQATGNSLYAKAAGEIFDYVLRDLHDSKGGFFSAEDADSFDASVELDINPEQRRRTQEKKEGAFYLWKFNEIVQLLGQEDSKIFNHYFGVEPNGNAKLDPQGEFIGKNILYVAHSIEETAQHFSLSVEEVNKIIERSHQKLFKARLRRPRPHLDDKILTDWNGLMISSLAFGGRVLRSQRTIQAAEESAQFILHHLRTKDGKLLHRFRDGEAGISATLMDYAFLIQGLLDLYEATFKVEYLKEALSLTNEMLRLFWDEKEGGFFFAAHDSADVILRQKEIYDGALPSGNSIAALDMVRLFHFTLDEQWEENAQKLFKVFSNDIIQHPSAYAQMLIALDFLLGPSQEVILSGDLKDPLLNQMIQNLFSKFIPNKVVIVRPTDQRQAQEIISLIPSLENQIPLEEKTTAYVCQNHVCQLPTSDLEKFEGLILRHSSVSILSNHKASKD